MRTLLLASLALAVAGVPGCGGSSSPSLVKPTDLDDALTSVFCDLDVKCGAIAAAEKAACPANRKMIAASYPGPYSRDEAVASKRLAFDPAAAQKCVEAWKTTGCSVDQQIATGNACAAAYSPLVMPGGACQDDGECIGGFCDNKATGCMATCKAYLAAGATCDPQASLCDGKRDYCDSAAKVCTARSGEGGKCGNGPRCLPGLFCIGATQMAMGACQKPGAVGAACNVYLFGNTSCSPELYCDDSGTKPVCAQRVASGGACSTYSACQDGLDCVGIDTSKMTTVAGACGAWLDLMKACDPSKSESGCPYDSLCDMTAKSCTARGGAGDDCSAAATGTNGFCRDSFYCDVNNKCSPQVAYGKACTPPATANDPDPCRDGSCSATAKVCQLTCM